VTGVAVIGTVVNADVAVTATSSSPGADCSPGRCIIDVGGSVTISAPDLPGRTFQGWSGDPGCTGSGRTLTLADVQTSKTCNAKFAARFQVVGVAAPAAGGSVVASSSGPNASCQDRACSVDEGSSVTLTARPSDSFRFTGWSGGGSCTGSIAALTLRGITTNLSCTANFVERFTVTSDVTPRNAGTTLATSVAAAADCSGTRCTVDARSDVSVLATPEAGYRFSSWSDCADSTANPLLVRNVVRAQNCTATFERITYVVAATASAGGSVSGTAGGSACSGARCTVAHGDDVSFSATSATGYMFGGWTGCVTSTQPTITLENVTAPTTCRATFTRVRVSVSAVAGDGGSVSASTGGDACAGARCTVDFGSSVMLSATPATGFQFGGWSDCTTSSNTSITLNDVTQNRTCRATFTRMRFTVSTSVAPAGSGQVTCGTAGCGADYGGSLTLAARPASGAWKFSRWSDCSTSTSADLTLSNITSARSCVAHFDPVTFQVVAGVAASGGGSVNCTGAGCTVGYGKSVDLTATPLAGFNFSSWACTPAVSNASASFTIQSVTSNYNCTASFAPVQRTVTASVAAGGGGTVSCTGGCRVNDGGSITLTATPASNAFTPDTWSCTPALSGSGATLTIPRVTSNYTCTVSFKPRTFTVTILSDQNYPVTASRAGASCPGAVCVEVPFGGSVDASVVVRSTLRPGAPILTRWRGCTSTSAQLGQIGESTYGFEATIRDVRSNLTCTAEFATSARVGAYADPARGGTVAVQLDSGLGYCVPQLSSCFLADGAVSVTTVAIATGWVLNGWRCGGPDGPVTADNPFSGKPVAAGQDIYCGALLAPELF